MFTIEELTILKMYWTTHTNRDELLHELERIRPLVDPPQLANTITTLLKKLKGITDADFILMHFGKGFL